MTQLKPKVGTRAAIFLVVSVIIGSGVFKKIAPMSQELGSPSLVLLCWIAAGLISLAGALSTAEMVSLYPNSGGEYFYFQKIFGRFFSFLCGWSSFTVSKTAAISALAYIFAQSINSIAPLPELVNEEIASSSFLLDNLSIKVLASLMIAGLTYLNYRGVHVAEKISRVLTYFMLLAIGTMVITGLTSSHGTLENFNSSGPADHFNKSLEGWGLVKAMFIASLGAFWGYEGWNNIAYIGEEIRDPKKNLPRALLSGTLIVISAYVLLNAVFLYVLPIDRFIEMNANPNTIAAVEVASVITGNTGSILVAGLIVVTTFNATNSSILMSARIVYAMARDRLFFPSAASVHPAYNTPDVALLLQGIWAIMLVFSGTFDQLTDMLVFAAFIFYGASALSVILMRIRHPEMERTYKVFGYPYIPVFFCLFSLGLFIMTIINQPKEAFWGLVLIGSGIPFYLWFNRTETMSGKNRE
jgi:APA family basic amino acid/polyamine antiporter